MEEGKGPTSPPRTSGDRPHVPLNFQAMSAGLIGWHSTAVIFHGTYHGVWSVVPPNTNADSNKAM